MSNVPGVITVTSAQTGSRLCFHTDFVSRVVRQPNGAVISVRGLGKVHTVESFHDVKVALKTAATEPSGHR